MLSLLGGMQIRCTYNNKFKVFFFSFYERHKENKLDMVLLENYLMECESIWADPRVSGVIVAVMEHFTSQAVVGVISGVLSHTVEF